jgi:hypothetical protein
MSRLTGVVAPSKTGKVTFDPTPVPVDRAWGFRLKLPNGEPDMITGFINADEARAWLVSGHCEDWLGERGYNRDKILARLKDE